MSPRIAVFAKNRTNPAYESASLGADRSRRGVDARLAARISEHYDEGISVGVLEGCPKNEGERRGRILRAAAEPNFLQTRMLWSPSAPTISSKKSDG